MADPIPHVVKTSGGSGSAPEGAIPIALYGAGGGGGGAVDSVNGKTGVVTLTAAELGAATVSDLAATTATANSAVQPNNLRLPIVLTRAQYDALNPPVAGQVYYIQG